MSANIHKCVSFHIGLTVVREITPEERMKMAESALSCGECEREQLRHIILSNMYWYNMYPKTKNLSSCDIDNIGAYTL